jgi:hypothetical protein
MYYTTTTDFHTFAPTRLFWDPGFSVIDCQILEVGQGYVLLLKDNTRPQRNLQVAFAPSPAGPWENLSAHLTPQFTEGPSGLKAGDDWLIYYDSYQAKRYGLLRTRDFKQFEDVSEKAQFPRGLKHGTAFKATRQDLDYLFKVGTQQVFNVRLPWVTPASQQRIQARLTEIDAVAKAGPFTPDWGSITNRFRAPEWYQNAKFGDANPQGYTAEDIRFTTRAGRLYAIALAWPGKGMLRVCILRE